MRSTVESLFACITSLVIANHTLYCISQSISLLSSSLFLTFSILPISGFSLLLVSFFPFISSKFLDSNISSYSFLISILE